MRPFIFVLLLCVLQGCGTVIPGTPWSRTDYTGPQLFWLNRAAVVTRCAAVSGFMSRGPCEYAFVDHRGQKVLWTDVQNAIDEYLPKVALLAPWVGARPGALSRSPYELHILTISPIVVLAVPRRDPSPFEDDYCGGEIYKNGCIPTRKMPLGSYWYQRDPLIGAGSFWFSPTLSSGVTFLPDDALTYTIELPDSHIKLVAKPNIKTIHQGNVWSIDRYALSK